MCCVFLSFRNLIVTYQTLTKTSQWRKLSWPHLQTKNFSRQWIKKSFMDSPSQASRPTSKKLNLRPGPDSAVWNPAVREQPRGTSDPDGIHIISSTVLYGVCFVVLNWCQDHVTCAFCIWDHLKTYWWTNCTALFDSLVLNDSSPLVLLLKSREYYIYI